MNSPNIKRNVNGIVYEWKCEIHPSAEICIKGSRDDDDNLFYYKWEINNLKGIYLRLFQSKESYSNISQCLQSAQSVLKSKYNQSLITESQQKDLDIIIGSLSMLIDSM
jgi:hypothetical protein